MNNTHISACSTGTSRQSEQREDMKNEGGDKGWTRSAGERGTSSGMRSG